MRRRWAWVLALLGSVGWTGCGGGAGEAGSGGTNPQEARLAVTLEWPAARTALPGGAASAVVSVRQGTTEVSRQVQARPTTGDTTVVLFPQVPVDTLTVEVTAHPDPAGAGVALARGQATVTTRAGEQNEVALTLASTVIRLEVAPAAITLVPGETATLTVVARDAAGEIVLYDRQGLEWKVFDGAVATLTAEGVIRAVTVGETVVRVRERASGALVNVPVRVGASDRGQIAFLSRRSGRVEMHLLDVGEGRVRQLTTNAEREDEMAFSRDGGALVYIANMGGSDFELCLLTLATGRFEQLTNNTVDEWGPCLSPDGRQIAYFATVGSGGTDELFIRSLDGREERRLTQNAVMDVLPVYTADGRALLFNSTRGGNYDLYRMEVQGGTVTRLTSGPEDEWYHAVSQDGRTIAFTAGNHLELMGSDGTGRRTLTTPSGYEDARPSFSPDGAQLAFASNRDGNWEIYTLTLATGAVTRLTNNPADDWAPVWGPICRPAIPATVARSSRPARQ
jgi:Tol biopolymer transport system component